LSLREDFTFFSAPSALTLLFAALRFFFSRIASLRLVAMLSLLVLELVFDSPLSLTLTVLLLFSIDLPFLTDVAVLLRLGETVLLFLIVRTVLTCLEGDSGEADELRLLETDFLVTVLFELFDLAGVLPTRLDLRLRLDFFSLIAAFLLSPSAKASESLRRAAGEKREKPRTKCSIINS
jgi:hypothetical protein